MSGLGMDLIRIVDRRLERALARVPGAVRGVIQALDGATKASTATIQAHADEDAADVEVAEQYGVTSSPPAEVEVIAVPVGGSSANLVVVGQLDRVHRPTDLEPGETCIYTSNAGTTVRIKPDGSIVLATSSGGSVELDTAGMVRLNGGGAQVARAGDPVGASADLVTLAGAVFALTGVGLPLMTGAAAGSITSGSLTVEAG